MKILEELTNTVTEKIDLIDTSLVQFAREHESKLKSILNRIGVSFDIGTDGKIASYQFGTMDIDSDDLSDMPDGVRELMELHCDFVGEMVDMFGEIIV